MIRDFRVVWGERGLLLSGLANTIVLSLLRDRLAGAGCPAGGAADVAARGLAMAAGGFVDGMRCIPFLLFAYIVYYGLPSLGHQLRQLERGPGGADHLQHRLHGRDPARRLGGSAARTDRSGHAFGFPASGCFAASSCRRCCCLPGR